MSEWISVKDRLPKPNSGRYLSWCGEKFCEIVGYGDYEWEEDGDDMNGYGWFFERENDGFYDNMVFDYSGKVTHWMPLPEPPQKDKP
jgi:hypothetical protein